MSSQQDSVRCQFYAKIGACRHGEKCSRKHIRPTSSSTILLSNLYNNPDISRTYTNKKTHTTNVVLSEAPQEKVDEYYRNFYRDVFIECSLVGPVTDFIVCENHNDHLNGSVYVRFAQSTDAIKARDLFSTRWYDSKPVYCELSPVTDFEEARCRSHEEQGCERGGMCNFWHVKTIKGSKLNEWEKETRGLRLSSKKYWLDKKLDN
ncbi:hypothetical protein WICPIJ_005768 [Wickerhamomyces pijperi]|uniref:C3H1-type domain-containing protein n=1 Tax=Wickerhamomyces pijperi TaxID=599730 RepID=A0A9P8TKU7_WICPI|nr:hypothetical protein WICPIJ_005768 [Wickerhamomyces pijperi]